MTRTRHLISLICNIATAVFVVYACVCMALGTDGDLSFSGAGMFKLFTVDSNVLAAVSCVCLIPFNIRGLRMRNDGQAGFPKAVLLFKFIGTVTVSITLLTVMCFLGPVVGYGAMFSGPNLWLHLVCPVLCIASLCFVETGHISIPQSLLGLIPVVLYGIWYFVMVVLIGEANGGWNDLYGFNQGGMWPVSMVIMYTGTLCVCLLLRLPHRK